MVLVAVAACEAATPSATAVLVPGAVAANPCEQAVVERAEAERDQGLDEASLREPDVYRTCTLAELEAGNAKLLDQYRYPGDLRTHVGRRCLRLISPYRGTKLCESL